MQRLILGFGLLPWALASLGVLCPVAGARAAARTSKMLLVVFENADYADALRQPDLARLARRGALLENFHAETHPSQPNYLALVAGDTRGVSGDGDADLAGRTIVDQLESRHKSWKVYLEGYPGGCFAGSRVGNYVRKHNPLIGFASVRNRPERCAHLVPAQQLAEDVRTGQLPDFALYIPDVKNDGHDTGVDFAGRWLSRELLPRLEGPLSRDLTLAVTFDESGSHSGDNRIYTALAGAGVRRSARSSVRYDHYSLLRTIEDRLHLGTLGAFDEKAIAIQDIWG